MIGVARLGKDVVVRDAGETRVANLALAFNYGKKDDDGKRPTQWVDASLWGDRADALAEYLTKGTSVFVILSDVHVEMKELDGGTRAFLKGRVDSIEFAGSSKKSDDNGGSEKPAKAAPKKEAPKKAEPAKDNFEDDDIPF